MEGGDGRVYWAAALLVAVLGPSNARAEKSAQEIFAAVSPAVCTLFAQAPDKGKSALGSAIRISEDGRVVTNFHVIDGATAVSIRCGGNEGNVTSVERMSEAEDLAVLLTTAVGPAARISDRKTIAPGSQVYAIGSSLGLEGSISSGLASGLRQVKGRSLIQISASISPGNSGGAIVDSDAEVIAVAVGTLAGGQNVNFAIPVWRVLELPVQPVSLESLAKRGMGKEPEARVTRTMPRPELDFRGIPLGTNCSGVAKAESERGSEVFINNPEGTGFLLYKKRPPAAPASAGLAFSIKYILHYSDRSPLTLVKGYPGHPHARATVNAASLAQLYGGEVLITYECSDSGLLVAGRYSWTGESATVFDGPDGNLDRLIADVSEKFGEASRSAGPAKRCLGGPQIGKCELETTTWGTGDWNVMLRVSISVAPPLNRPDIPAAETRRKVTGVQLLYLDSASLREIREAVDLKSKGEL